MTVPVLQGEEMATVLDAFPKRMRKNGGAVCKYPWDAWLDGRIWKLVPGVDFTCKVNAFRTTASQFGHRYQKMVHTFIDTDGSVILSAEPEK